MQSGLLDSWRPLLDFILTAAPRRGDGGVSLQAVAEGVGMTSPSTLRHLQAMTAAGWVERRGERKDARYYPARRAALTWTGMVGTGRWLHLEWQAHGDVDWRFPLVSRLPDPASRLTVIRFLEALEDADALSPWKMFKTWMHERELDAAIAAIPTQHQKAWKRALTTRPSIGVPAVWVFGSAVQGTQRPDSDVDVFVVTPIWGDHVKGLEDLRSHRHRRGERGHGLIDVGFKGMVDDAAARINLGAARQLDVVTVEEDSVTDLPPPLLESIRREAVTVYPGTVGYAEQGRPYTA